MPTETLALFSVKVANSPTRETMPSLITKDEFPKRPLTEDEVVTAIRGWDREEHKIDDKRYGIFQRIAESRVLPPGAKLSFNYQWYHYRDDEHESLVWWNDLTVWTSKTTGYTFRIRDERLGRRPVLLPSAGYTWIVEPRDVTPSRRTRLYAHNGVTLEARRDEKGALAVTAAWLQREDTHGWRLVAFDEKANRYILDPIISAGSGKLTMRRFRLDPAALPAHKVKHLGFEAVSAANLRRVSELAVRRAEEKGIEILSWPQVGGPYEFRLTTTEGQIIDSRTLHGKVLLIDCWASWCGPCMRQMPELKKMYAKWHAQGLEIVCLSFDGDVGAARAAFELHEIPWPMVIVPDDKDVRHLWREAVRVPPIPRVFLIDRQGVLRFDGSFSPGTEGGLEEKIGALLDGSSTAIDDPPQRSPHN